MSVKVRILLCIATLSIIGVIFIVADSADEIRHNPEYTAETSATATDSGIFFMEYWNGMGRLYKVSSTGSVQAMTHSKNVGMENAVAVAAYERNVYALYSSSKKDKDGSYKVYRIVSYDTDLNPAGVTDPFTIDSDCNVCSMTADGLGFYIAAISENNGHVAVFSVPNSKVRGFDALDDETVDPEKRDSDTAVSREDYPLPDALLLRERTAARFFVDAVYKEGELYVLLDGDSPTGVFAPDPAIKSAIDSIHFSFGQNIRLRADMIIRIAGIFLIWLIMVILVTKLTKDRDRIVYLYMASEVGLFLILFLAFVFIKQQFQKNEQKTNTRYILSTMQDTLKYYNDVDYETDDFYDSTKYYRLLENFTQFVKEAGDENMYRDVFIMRRSTGVILVDARGYNRVHASYLYGGDMSNLLEVIQSGESYGSVDISHEGERMSAVAYESDNPQDDLAVVAVYRDEKGMETHRSSVIGLGILFIVIFVIGSVLMFIVLYLQHVDLKRFSGALKRLALGEAKEDSPKNVSRDMRELWQSYGELGKRIEEINYDKYMIFEAYYRFAPKGIETIMGKESILDVKNGDVVDVSGSMVLLSIDEDEEFEKKVHSLSSILVNLENYAKSNEGILVSRDPSLSNIRFLLLKGAGNTVSQIVQMLNTRSTLAVNDLSVMMYWDRLSYGVIGSNSQSLTYIDSEFSLEMDAYAAWFRKLGARVVVTDNILSAEDVGENRYVGTALFKESGNRVQFFEVLDVYPAKTRQLMLINRSKFVSTLELFYSRDFYLARNQFMEILKDCPEDGIVKWYIFECERYMNGDVDTTYSQFIRLD